MDYYNIASEEKRTKAMEDMKNYYNGYLFNEESTVRLYNPDMVLHFMPLLSKWRIPPNLVIKEIYWQYIYRKVNRVLGDTVDIYSITKVTQILAETGNPKAFIEYAFDKVIQYISNRDLIKMEEKHIKMIFLSFLSMNEIYIPYSEKVWS